jgi:hypothetical protein
VAQKFVWNRSKHCPSDMQLREAKHLPLLVRIQGADEEDLCLGSDLSFKGGTPVDDADCYISFETCWRKEMGSVKV